MQPIFDKAQTLPESAPLVFIDAGVENAEQLMGGVISTAEVFLIEKTADGVEQISRVLQRRRNVGAVHIISHGAPGCLYLGDGELSLDTLNRYAPQLRRWDVDNLLLYGCRVAAGDAGEEFVAELRKLTGAEIAASKSLTGAALKGGNWELELRTGEVKSAPVLTGEAMASYRGVLNTISESEPNSTIATAQLIDVSDFSLTFDPHIQAEDGTNISTTIPHVSIEGTGDDTFDYYRFSAQPGTWRFDIDDNNFDTELFLYDTDGNLLAANDDLTESGHTGGILSSYITFDISAPGSYVIGVGRIGSTGDPGGITGNAPDPGDTYTLHIVGVGPNLSPTDLTLDVNTIDETVPIGTVVGTFSTTDPNAADTAFTYELVAGAGDTDNAAFSIDAATGELSVNASPDYETQSWYNIRVRTTDPGGLSYEEGFIVNVNDVNEAPTAVTLSNNTVDEKVAAGTTVGRLGTADPDAGDSFTYSLAGGTDDGNFTIDGDRLQITTSPDHDTQATYSIAVKTTDSGGLESTETLTINVNDLSQTSTGSGILRGGVADDNLTGGAGRDRLYGYGDDDILNGGDGDDLLYGGDGNDQLNGGAGRDRLRGDAGGDLLNGGDGDDLLYGGDGSDLLNGGAGRDRLYGDAGSDLFVLQEGMGRDLIYGFEDGVDQIQVLTSMGVIVDFGSLTVTARSSSTLIEYNGETLATLYRVDASLIDAGDFVGASPS